MLRIEVMGLQDSVTRQPTPAELDRMTGILDEAYKKGTGAVSPMDCLCIFWLTSRI